MTDKDIKTINAIRSRIKELDTEIYALFDAMDKKVKPKNPFKVRGYIHSNDYMSDAEIKLTNADIQMLQMIRSEEKETLEKILKEL